jgi:uncharacterized protein
MDRQHLLAEIKRRLLKAHGHRLRSVVLYGSEARGEAQTDSDIDVLVLLDGPVDYGRDLRANIDALCDLMLALERPISAKPVDVAAYEAAKYPLYVNAKAEGLIVGDYGTDVRVREQQAKDAVASARRILDTIRLALPGGFPPLPDA